jgi:hypothetical protein
MATIARILTQKFSATALEVEILKQLAMFCGVGLLVSLFLVPGWWQRDIVKQGVCFAFQRWIQ